MVSLSEEDGAGHEPQPPGHYCGGGTWFEAIGPEGTGKVVNASIGKAVLFAGPLKHAGFPITRGVRHILVLFLYVDQFHYGPYLTTAKEANQGAEKDAVGTPDSNVPVGSQDANISIAYNEDTDRLPSGGKKGGFVVYRQTVDLVTMLEKAAVVDEDE